MEKYPFFRPSRLDDSWTEETEEEKARLRQWKERIHTQMLVAAEERRLPAAALDAAPARNPEDLYSLFTDKPGAQYEVRDIIARIDARDVVAQRLVARVDERGQFGGRRIGGIGEEDR